MPIHQNNTRISIDFQYEFTLPDDSVITYNMKFVHTPQGPIISISQDGYPESYDLPADMFSEVYTFLNTQGVFRGLLPNVVSAPQINTGGVALPNINKRSPINVKTPSLRGNPQPLVQAQQESPLVVLPQDAHNTDITIDPEEAEAIISQRAAAKAKANTDKAKLRPNHKK